MRKRAEVLGEVSFNEESDYVKRRVHMEIRHADSLYWLFVKLSQYSAVCGVSLGHSRESLVALRDLLNEVLEEKQ